MIDTLVLTAFFAVVAAAIGKLFKDYPSKLEVISEALEAKIEKEKEQEERKGEEQLIDLEILLTDAEQAQKRKEHDEAERLLKKAIRQAPENIRAQTLLASVLFDQEKYNEAVAQTNDIVETDPLNATAYNILGLSYFALKNYEKAAKAFEHSLTIDRSKSQRYVNLALAFKELKKHKKEVSALKKAYLLEPDNRDIIRLLARAAVNAKDKGAKSALEQLLKLDQDDEWAKRELARLK